MRLWIKRTIVISLTLLWFTLSILLLRFVDNTAVKIISICILVALAAVSVVSGYIYVNDLRDANKVLNAFANREKRTFIFCLNYETSVVKVYNDTLNVEHVMKLKNFAKKYLGIVENSKEYVALVLGKLDLDYYNKSYIKVVDDQVEKYYKFKCLLTEPELLWGSIELIEE
jgi:hypothetical protein